VRKLLSKAISAPARAVARRLAEDRVVSLIALAFVVTELVAVAWDVPGSHGWENDGVAPRDLFGGLAENLQPGHSHRYPLLHYLVLAVPCLPLLLAAVLGGPLGAEAIRGRVLSVFCMSGISVVARLVAIAMAALAVVALARIVRRTCGTRAGRLAALFAATNLTFAFYGRVSNLDVPYLAWTVFALDKLLDVAETGEPRRYYEFGALAAAAVATKDQAYGSFVLVAPLYLVILPLTRPSPFQPGHFRLLAKAAGLSALAYAAMSGALFNPTGFLKRVGELTGSSSQDWRLYSRDAAGMARNVRDVLEAQARYFWPLPLTLIAWSGALFAPLMRRGDAATKLSAPIFRAMPLVAGASSLVFFSLLVARSEHRFLLPLGFFLSAGGGVLSDWALGKLSSSARRPAHAVLGVLLAWAFASSFAVTLTQLGDSRRSVRALLAELPAGSVVETYGGLVYQPHFDVSGQAPYRVERVGPELPKRRNPLVGATERQGAIEDAEARKPDAIVISEGFANSYLDPDPGIGAERSNVSRRRFENTPVRAFVQAAVDNRLPNYRVARVAEPSFPELFRRLGFAPVAIQSTTGLKVWVLLRAKPRPIAASE
jgi:hypothetical protein